jgi:hypothetical protein
VQRAAIAQLQIGFLHAQPPVPDTDREDPHPLSVRLRDANATGAQIVYGLLHSLPRITRDTSRDGLTAQGCRPSTSALVPAWLVPCDSRFVVSSPADRLFRTSVATALRRGFEPVWTSSPSCRVLDSQDTGGTRHGTASGSVSSRTRPRLCSPRRYAATASLALCGAPPFLFISSPLSSPASPTSWSLPELRQVRDRGVPRRKGIGGYRPIRRARHHWLCPRCVDRHPGPRRDP